MNWIKLIALVGAVAILGGGSALAQGLDYFTATGSGDGTLLIQHLNSYHNCCVPIGHEVEIDGFTIRVREIEPYINGCWCLCYFDVDLEISDLPPGPYSIEYTYDIDPNLYENTWLVEIFGATVPELGLAPEVPEFVSTISECHDGHPVAVQNVKFEQIKTYYR